VLLVAPYIADMGALVSMIVLSAFLLAAAAIAQFGVPTRGKRLDEVSP